LTTLDTKDPSSTVSSKSTPPPQLVPKLDRSELICMIGIPANINCNELLDFVIPFSETIEYMRIIRDTTPNQYMALFKFISQVHE
jgi:hypothetical protein